MTACEVGRMDRQITIEQRSVSADAAGQQIETWTDLATEVWAEWIPASGREVFEAQQYNALSVASFRIHYRGDITRADHRIVYNGDTYDIVEADEDRKFGYKEFLLIRAVARRS